VSDSQVPTDKALLQAFHLGRDETAFEELVRRYEERLRRFARSLFSRYQREDLAQFDVDTAQDTLVKLYFKAENLLRNSSPSLKAWLFKVLANRVRDVIRQNRTRAGSLDSDLTEASQESNTYEIPSEVEAALRHCLSELRQLRPMNREVIDQIYWGELSVKEVADLLRTSYGSASYRHRQALEFLLACVQGQLRKKNGGTEGSGKAISMTD
jgi:RNA polymerase sigma factor (sigma-70 family)